MGNSAEKVEYQISEQGAAKTAEGFDRVADALGKSAKMADAFRVAQADSGALARMATYRAEAERVNASANATTATIAKLTAASNDNAKALAGMGRQVSEVGTQIGQLVGSATGLTNYQTAIDAVSRTVAATTAELVGGIGVGGIVTGGLVLAAGAMGIAFASSVPDIDEVSNHLITSARSMSDYAATVKKLRGEVMQGLTDSKSDAAFAKRIGEGGGSSAELLSLQVAEVAAVRKHYSELLGKLHAETSGPQTGLISGLIGSLPHLDDYAAANGSVDLLLGSQEAEIQAVNDRYAKLTTYAVAAAANERDKAELAAALSTESPLIGKDVTAKKRVSRVSDYASAVMGDDYGLNKPSWLVDLEAQQAARAKELAGEKKDAALRLSMQQSLDSAIIASVDHRNKFELEASKNLLKVEQASAQEKMQFTREVGQVGAQIVAAGISSAIAGKKFELKEILTGLGTMEIAKGTMAIVDGGIRAAWSYGSDPSAYTMMSLGAQELAMGIALSGAGAAMGGGSHASAGGGGSVGGYGGAGSAPYRDNSSGSGTVIHNTTYVEFTSPFAPSAATGLQIRQHLTAANNVHGKQV